MPTKNQIEARKLHTKLKNATAADMRMEEADPYSKPRRARNRSYYLRLQAATDALADVRDGDVKGAKAAKVISRAKHLLTSTRFRRQGGVTDNFPLKKGKCAFAHNGSCLCKAADGRTRFAKASRCSR